VNWARFSMASLASPHRPRALTKRVAPLIGSLNWNAGPSDQGLLAEAAQEVERLKGLGKRSVAMMEGRVMEKPASPSPAAMGPTSASQSETAHSLTPRLALQCAAGPAPAGAGTGQEASFPDDKVFPSWP
jgi:hypothetical protein